MLLHLCIYGIHYTHVQGLMCGWEVNKHTHSHTLYGLSGVFTLTWANSNQQLSPVQPLAQSSHSPWDGEKNQDKKGKTD